MTLDAQGTNATVRAGLNGQVPRCDHVAELSPVEPGPAECAACVALGRAWTRLLVCLSCGWVACADDARGGHARAHYEETDHPVVAALAATSTWRWCYVHRRTV
ncbi:UBP-type zinc finger domain-containing protein [Nonomuraea gerenzanensis]|uniref:UBP-type domain-containing protein n=1 Tax=Nonomuraea gerenzanensis TaxID=93944 RepID=A0A1M4EM84_9ACTN|nr:UBP-type zinc finger domain-containing protein [Nonomuraea gerenzanensis]UBU11462.1 UBP-type zinc finger domain-containing protein [Nonomuraea gerenzanensis]SBO99947.1 hypothetical protein BN4615_P9463 [Nonomuraea gerenzanensis]